MIWFFCKEFKEDSLVDFSIFMWDSSFLRMSTLMLLFS